MDSVIAVRDLRMRYGENDVLTGVSFDIRAGEVACLLGPNGGARPPPSRSWSASGCVPPAT
ncbi:MAG TPA: hypothetical protein VLJ88_02880 [Propionibacteriaceae bacterium]|nr:hypothetical protein [Propionibacteriaceae bacterium]